MSNLALSSACSRDRRSQWLPVTRLRFWTTSILRTCYPYFMHAASEGPLWLTAMKYHGDHSRWRAIPLVSLVNVKSLSHLLRLLSEWVIAWRQPTRQTPLQADLWLLRCSVFANLGLQSLVTFLLMFGYKSRTHALSFGPSTRGTSSLPAHLAFVLVYR